ncbi:PREDICTED: uncharacterized protein LOC109206328 [Nicotiana attenuata]|uniref:uncharacterized protein LOC109206328 n=1 Tax=Nicotiana attenuata TaxID=49451 RepID=UPI000904971E|nr:PREDICTED: uncharacterized protein LOC109206328 [Nicotiana attenuata]
MKEDLAAEPVFTQINIPPNHMTPNPKKTTSLPPLQNIHRGITTTLEILKKKDAIEELEKNYPSSRTNSIMLDSVSSIEFSTEVSEVIVVLCPRTMSKCGMSLVSAQTQGSLKPLLNLTPILSLKRKSPPPLVPILPGPSSLHEGSHLPPTSPMMNYIIWNVRGGNGAEFKRHCLEMVKMYRPTMLVLLETKMADHQALAKTLDFDMIIQSPAVGSSRGIVFMWKEDLVAVEEVATTSQGIHAMVKVRPDQPPWFFSAIYASNILSERKLLWEQLTTIARTTSENWFIGGDFNEVLKARDKFGGNPINLSRSNQFWNCINKYNLIDLGYKGSKYTWTNKRYSNCNTLILERIDRCFANEGWIKQYPEAFKDQPTLLQSIDEFKKLATKWNKEVFGNIFHQKNRLLARISGIQRSASYQFSSFLQNLESELNNELNLILKNEEDFWKLKSRINWLNDGDASTRFFHTSTLNRRRRNRILSLKEDNGNWITDQKEIQSTIVDFFTKLYTTSHFEVPWATTNHSTMDPTLLQSHKAFMDMPLQMSEIKKVVFSNKPFKSPGPDGLHPFLYKKYWDVVGESVSQFCMKCFNTCSMDSTMNQTLLCLIPKFPQAC